MFGGVEVYLPMIVGIVLGLLLLAFALEIRPPEVTAIAAVAILLIAGVLDADDVLGALSNPAPLTIAAMFIVSASLVRTGMLSRFATMVTARAKQSPRQSVAMLLVMIAALSAFTNNTPLVMMMIPIGIVLARELGEASSKLLMPISFAAILGGTCTLIGTSTNILVDGVAREAGLRPFSIFEIAPVGIVVAIAGVVYLVIARRFLPERQSVASQIDEGGERRYLISVAIDHSSPFLGRDPVTIPAINGGSRLLVDVIRDTESILFDEETTALQEGDILVIRCPAEELLTIKEEGRLKLARVKAAPEVVAEINRPSTLMEALLLQDAKIVGHRLSEIDLQPRYNVHPVALHRRSDNFLKRFEDEPLEVGDTILLEGAREDLIRLIENESLVNMAEPNVRGFRMAKAPIALLVLAAIVGGAAIDVLPLATLAVLGVAVVLVTRCVDPEEAFSSVDWRIIALIVAMLAIGTALEKAMLVEMAVGAVTPFLGHYSPFIALVAIYVLSLALTELVTNNAVAVVVTPVAIQLAEALGSDPRPFIIAVMFAASASFLTPIGYQTNTLVYGAGGYRFGDFFRFGWPLTLIVGAATLTAIPIFWQL